MNTHFIWLVASYLPNVLAKNHKYCNAGLYEPASWPLNIQKLVVVVD